MMLQASLLRSSIPAALRRSSSTQVGATTGGSDGATSASLSGYINLDEEETIIEEVRALDQFKPIVLSSAQVIRSKHLVFQRELFRYQHLTSRPVLTRLKAAEDKQEIERRKELKANRRRLILSGKTPVKIEPLLPPATQLSGGYLESERQLKELENVYTVMSAEHQANPDANFDMVLATHGLEIPVSAEKRDRHLLEAMLDDYHVNPTSILKYQGNIAPKDKQRNSQPDLDTITYLFARHSAKLEAITSARELLHQHKFETRLPANMPTLEATATFNSVSFQPLYETPEDNNHTDDVTNHVLAQQEEEADAEASRLGIESEAVPIDAEMLHDRDEDDDDDDDDESKAPRGFGDDHDFSDYDSEDELGAHPPTDLPNQTSEQSAYHGDGRGVDSGNERFYRKGSSDEPFSGRASRGSREESDSDDEGTLSDDGEEIVGAQAIMHLVEEDIHEPGIYPPDHIAAYENLFRDNTQLHQTGINQLALLEISSPAQRALLRVRRWAASELEQLVEECGGRQVFTTYELSVLDRQLKRCRYQRSALDEVVRQVIFGKLKKSPEQRSFEKLIATAGLAKFQELLKAEGGLGRFKPATQEALELHEARLNFRQQLRDAKMSPESSTLSRCQALLMQMEVDGLNFQGHEDVKVFLREVDRGLHKVSKYDRDLLEFKSTVLGLTQASNTTLLKQDALHFDLETTRIDEYYPHLQSAHDAGDITIKNSHHLNAVHLNALARSSLLKRPVDPERPPITLISPEEFDSFGYLSDGYESDASDTELLLGAEMGSNEVPDYMSDDEEVAYTENEAAGNLAVLNSTHGIQALDRYIISNEKRQGKMQPLVAEKRYFLQARRRCGRLLVNLMTQFLQSDSLRTEDNTTQLGLIYNVAHAYRRSAEEVHTEASAIFRNWVDNDDCDHLTKLTEQLDRVFSSPASLGIQRSIGETQAEAAARAELRQEQITQIRTHMRESGHSVGRDAANALEFLEGIREDFVHSDDKRLADLLILLHCHTYQVAAHWADPASYECNSTESSIRMLNCELEEWAAAWLPQVLNWADEEVQAGLPIAGNAATVIERPSLAKSGLSVVTVEYCEPMGPKIQQDAVKLSQRKVSLVIDIGKLSLPAPVEARLQELTQTRYDPVRRTLRVVADAFPDTQTNHRYARQLIRQIMTEAFKAHPSFVPFSDLSATTEQLRSSPPETPKGPLLSDAYYRLSLLGLSPADVDSIKDPDQRWQLKQELHQHVLFRSIPFESRLQQ